MASIQAFLNRTTASAKPSLPFQKHSIPKSRSEIRGVDNMVHQLLQRKFPLKKFAPIMQNEFLSVQLFPQDHTLSNFRKSNVSLVFNMHQIPMLNDKCLESGFKSRPKYKDLQFFNKKPSPMQSACGRTKSKKQVRELFAQSLSTFSMHDKKDRLSGIFVCHVVKVPVNQEQRDLIRKDFENMCSALLDKDDIWNNLNKQYKRTKSPNLQQLKYVQFSYGVKNLIDRRLRFPFSPKRGLKFITK
ncbi:hypothetical protein CANMA_004240 [Candida margitis]|uniref:uncharacterized protein n=1 Tax=Candida margitis TaxID=1775924 RepID=UPI0022260859|nr:uncharacterized protein CANMA_004240 [Candida margitis]KAI5958396.1 hypothetical protein CANMA_004240 [Candida margitis]